MLSQRSSSSATTSELGLIKRVAQADLRACRVLCHRLSGRVQHLVRRLLGDSDSADAIVVDALIEILRAASIYRRDAGIETWADRIAVRVALDRTPRRGRFGASKGARRRLLPPVRSLAIQGPAHRVTACLATLPDHQRQILVLQQLARLELKVIATLMRTTEAAVHDELLQARAAVRELLAPKASASASELLARRRWVTCMDRSALGEALGDEEQAFCDRFVATDALAASEREFLQELGRHELEPNAQSRALVDAVLQRFAARGEQQERDEAARIKTTEDGWRGGWLFIAGSSVLLALIVWLLPQSRIETRIAHVGTAAAPAVPRMRVVYAAGDVRIDGELVTPESATLTEGATLSVGAGSACVVIDPGLALCAGSATLLRVSVARGAARQFDLETGELAISLPLQPHGVELALTSGTLHASSSGATFTLQADPLQGTRAAVLDGSVNLTPSGAAGSQVTARHAAVLREGRLELEPLPPDEASAAAELLLPVLGFRRPLTATLDLRGLPPDAEVELDDRLFGSTPLLAVIPAGPHALRVRKDDQVIVALGFSAETARPTTLALSDAPPAEPAAASITAPR